MDKRLHQLKWMKYEARLLFVGKNMGNPITCVVVVLVCDLFSCFFVARLPFCGVRKAGVLKLLGVVFLGEEGGGEFSRSFIGSRSRPKRLL